MLVYILFVSKFASLQVLINIVILTNKNLLKSNTYNNTRITLFLF